MKMNIFFGSIIVVTVLISISFTSVVGYRSAGSNVMASPLFNIRSSRAIDEEGKDLTRKYVGKGEENKIIFPIRDIELSLIYRTINKINQMDEELMRFKIPQLNQLHLDKRMNNQNLHGLLDYLCQIIEKHKDKINKFHNELDNPVITPFTIYGPIYLLIILFFMVIFGLYVPIISIYAGVTCDLCCFIYDPYILGN